MAASIDVHVTCYLSVTAEDARRVRDTARRLGLVVPDASEEQSIRAVACFGMATALAKVIEGGQTDMIAMALAIVDAMEGK